MCVPKPGKVNDQLDSQVYKGIKSQTLKPVDFFLFKTLEFLCMLFQVDETKSNVDLLISQVKPQMFRAYTFIAKNELGTSNYTVTLERGRRQNLDLVNYFLCLGGFKQFIKYVSII